MRRESPRRCERPARRSPRRARAAPRELSVSAYRPCRPAAARETQISELTEGAVAWQAAYSELERGLAQTDRAESLRAELKATEELRAAADASERARAELEARLGPLEAQLAERSEELEQVRDVLASYWEGAKKHLVLFQDAGGYEPVEQDDPPPAPAEPSYY